MFSYVSVTSEDGGGRQSRYFGGRRLKSLGTPVLDDKFYPLKRYNGKTIIFNCSLEGHQRGTLQCLSIVS